VLNVTAVGPSVGGFLTVFPADVSVVPTASNINWNPGQTIPNLVTVKLPVGDPATAGKIKVFNDVGAVDVVADVVGYYGPSGSAFHALAPTRILESRFANGNLQGQWSAGQTRSLDVTDTHGSGVPAGSVAKAVVMNVTVTGTDDAGFLTLFPAGLGSPPNASNLNWSRGDTIPNLTITKVDPAPGDNVKIFNQRGNAYVIADVVGWFGGRQNRGKAVETTGPARTGELRLPARLGVAPGRAGRRGDRRAHRGRPTRPDPQPR